MSALELILGKRQAAAVAGNNSTGVAAELVAQWANPADISTILLIIGGDVVQKAFAQGSGKFYVPVCFSFGCVAYAFLGLELPIRENPPDLVAE